MMRTRKANNVRIEEILDASLRLFRQDGYASVQIEHIRQASGLSRGGFYHHFESKPAVLRALVERDQEALVARCGPDLVALIAMGSTYASANAGVEETLSEPDDIALYLNYLAAAQDRLLAPLLSAAISRDGDGALPPDHVAQIFLGVNARITRQVMTGAWSEAQARAFSVTALTALAGVIGRPGLFDPLLDRIGGAG